MTFYTFTILDYGSILAAFLNLLMAGVNIAGLVRLWSVFSKKDVAQSLFVIAFCILGSFFSIYWMVQAIAQRSVDQAIATVEKGIVADQCPNASDLGVSK